MTQKHTKYTNEWFSKLKTIIPKIEKIDNVEKSLVDKLKDERQVLVDNSIAKHKEIIKKIELSDQEQAKLDNQAKYSAFMNNGTSQYGLFHSLLQNPPNTKNCLMNYAQAGFTDSEGKQKIHACCKKCKANAPSLNNQRDKELVKLITSYKQVGESLAKLLKPIE